MVASVCRPCILALCLAAQGSAALLDESVLVQRGAAVEQQSAEASESWKWRTRNGTNLTNQEALAVAISFVDNKSKALVDGGVTLVKKHVLNQSSPLRRHVKQVQHSLSNMIGQLGKGLKNIGTMGKKKESPKTDDDDDEVATPVALLQEAEVLELEKPPHPAEKIAIMKQKVSNRVAEVAKEFGMSIGQMNSKMEKDMGSMMTKANAAADDIQAAAGNALQGVKDLAETASEPMVKSINQKTMVMNSKVKAFINRINGAVGEMKNGMREFAHGMTEGMKEASEKIAAQVAQSVHEHVRQEIELARAAEPAS